MNNPLNPVSHGVREGDHRQGAPMGDIVLIEYGDFQCPTCKQAVPAVDLLRATSRDRLLFVFRHYPLEQLHPEALIAAEAAESAGRQGRFWEMHALLFANQERLTMPHLDGYAEQLDLDMARFRDEMWTHVHQPRVRADIALGQQAKVRSTPGFILNGRIQDVSFGMRGLHDAVQAALGS